MLKELTQHIANETGLIIGSNLFAGFIPADIVDNCVVVIESGGGPNFYLPDAGDIRIQVLSRSSDYWVARENAFKIYDALHGVSGITLPVVTAGEEYELNTIEAISVPQSVGQDDRGLFNISTNYVLHKQDK